MCVSGLGDFANIETTTNRGKNYTKDKFDEKLGDPEFWKNESEKCVTKSNFFLNSNHITYKTIFTSLILIKTTFLTSIRIDRILNNDVSSLSSENSKRRITSRDLQALSTNKYLRYASIFFIIILVALYFILAYD
jgi:hypothetical protein